jgi:hypothetical protein
MPWISSRLKDISDKGEKEVTLYVAIFHTLRAMSWHPELGDLFHSLDNPNAEKKEDRKINIYTQLTNIQSQLNLQLFFEPDVVAVINSLLACISPTLCRGAVAAMQRLEAEQKSLGLEVSLFCLAQFSNNSTLA